MWFSAFEERKKKEFEEVNPPPPKLVNASMTIALDQWEHSIVPSRVEYLNQEIQWEKGKDKLKSKDESSEEENFMPEQPAEHIRRSTITRQNVNGIPMVVELPSNPMDIGTSDGRVDKEEIKYEAEKPKILTKEETDKIQDSADFVKFFNKASRLVERGLFSEIDVIGSFERLEVEEGDTAISKDKKMAEKITFLKDNPVRRSVTNLEWSPKHKELFLCSYYTPENEWDQNETNGLINIFSTQMPASPEITLTCQSEITSCIFHPIEPYLVIGGTFSGNVIVWDMREKRNYPIVKTPTAASIMIKGIRVVGSQNANNIVTVSNDGIVWVWSLNMMKEPQKKVDLSASVPELSLHCIDMPEGETNQFYIGSEDSKIYHAKIHTKSDKEVNISESYEGHSASILSLHCHPTIENRKSDISNLLLSTGADWNIGVWNPKTRKDPILIHDSEVEIYDAQWSPVHPSVFAACNGNGQIELWDLSKETEECVYRHEVDKRAINKIRWSYDGKRILSGNSNGTVKLWSVKDSFYQYREEDLTKFEKMFISQSQSSYKEK